MDIKKIKEMLELMNRENLVEIEIEEEGKSIRLRKKEEYPLKEVKVTSADLQPKEEPKESESIDANALYIKSPMVGTFYRSSSPDMAPYIELNKNVEAGDTVCIVEAMKLMNEIKSEFKGKVTEILVENGDPVDFGQPLFKIVAA